jgi:hypothetical protein
MTSDSLDPILSRDTQARMQQRGIFSVTVVSGMIIAVRSSCSSTLRAAAAWSA